MKHLTMSEERCRFQTSPDPYSGPGLRTQRWIAPAQLWEPSLAKERESHALEHSALSLEWLFQKASIARAKSFNAQKGKLRQLFKRRCWPRLHSKSLHY